MLIVKNKWNKHLSDDELINFVYDYYQEKIKFKAILEKYRFKAFHRHIFPTIVKEFIECKSCGNNLTEFIFISKSDYKKISHEKNLNDLIRPTICCQCGHNHQGPCSCNYCKNLKLEEEKTIEQKKRDLIFKKFYVEKTYFEIDRIPIDVLLCLYAFKEANKSFESDIKLIPGFFFDEFIKITYPKYISIHCNSPLDAFTFEQEQIININKKIMFDINIKNIEDFPDSLDFFKNKKQFENLDLLLNLSKKIKIAECYEYLNNEAMKVGFNFKKSSELLNMTFDHALNTFDVEQIYSLIYSATKQLVYRMKTEKLNFKHAFNLWPYTIGSVVNSAINNGWKVSSYQRPYCCLKSLIRIYLDFIID